MKKAILILMFMFVTVMLLAQPDPVAYIIGAETQTTDVTDPVWAQTVLVSLNADLVDPSLNWTPAEWDLVLGDFTISDGITLVPVTAAEVSAVEDNYISLSFDYTNPIFQFGPEKNDLNLHYINSGIDITTENLALQNTLTAVNIDDGIAPMVFTYAIASNNANPYLGEVGDIVTFTFESNEALANIPVSPEVTFTAPESDATETVTATMVGDNQHWSAVYTIPASPNLNGRITCSATFTDVHANSGSLTPAVDEGTDGTFCVVKNYLPAYTYVGAGFNSTTLPAANVSGDTDDLIYLWSVFKTVQEGIDGVASGGQVNVTTGTYNEDLTIDKTLELLPYDAGTDVYDVVKLKGVATVAAGLFPLADANIDVLATGVSIHDFTIEAPDYVVGFYSSGILIGGTNATIYDNDFLANTVSSTDDISQSIQTYNTVDISGLDIYTNTFDDVVADVVGWGYEAIYINPGGTGNVNIEDNTIGGACFRGITAQRSNVTIEGNDITTTQDPASDDWSTPGAWVGIWAYTDISDITIIDNTVYGTVGGTGFNRGIRLGSTGGSTFTTLSVTGNEIYYNKNGIYSQSATGITITGNAFENNTEFGVFCDTGTLNAEDNWWGSGSGPDHADNTFTNPAGDPHGDTSSDFVDYVPWYDTDMTGSSFWPITLADSDANGYFSSFNTAIDAAAGGETITAALGTYTENVVVDKGLSLQGVSGNIIAPTTGCGVEIQASTVTVDGFTINTLGTDAHGLHISIGATDLTLTDNVITIGGYSTAIYADAGPSQSAKSSGWTISGNTLSAPAGVNMELYDVDVVTVDDNTFMNALGSNVIFSSELFDLTGPIVFTNNDVQGNDGGSMVAFVTDFQQLITVTRPDVIVTTMDDVTITGNTFDGWAARGLRIGDWGGDVTNVVVNYNSFEGTGIALANQDAVSLDAEDNWWGSANGPVHNNNTFNVGSQGCDVVENSTGTTDFVPWYDTNIAGSSFWPVELVGITGSGYFSSIQTAIDASAGGETIECKTGTFTEDFLVDKGLSLEGITGQTVTLLGEQEVTAGSVFFDNFVFDPGGAGTAILVNSSAGVIDELFFGDCTFTLTTSPSIGIFLGGGGTPNKVSDIIIENNIFNGPTDKICNPWKVGGSFGNNVSCEIDGLLFYNNEVNKGSIPVNLVDANLNEIWLKYNDFYDTDGIIYFWNSPTSSPTGVLSNFVFENNYVPSTNSYGVAIGGASLGGPTFTDANFGTGNAINDNAFEITGTTYGYGAVYMADNYTGLLDAKDNWWGDQYGPTNENSTYTPPPADAGSVVSDRVEFARWWNSGTNAITTRGWEADAGATLFAPVTNVTQTTYHSSIQRGVDSATSGDVLECLAGTFDECVTIDKPLTLQGDENAEAITYLKPSFAHMDAATVKNVNDAPVLNADFQSVLLVDYTGTTLTTIQDFMIDGSAFNTGTPASGGYFAGIFFDDCAGTVSNITFDDIYTLDNKGVGIVYEDDSGTDKTTEVEDCAFNTCPTGALWFVFTNAMGNIHDNTLDDSRNTIMFLSSSSTTASVVDNNTFTNCQRGVLAYPFNADVKIDITDNTFDFSGVVETTSVDVIIGNSSAVTYSFELDIDNNDFIGNFPPGTEATNDSKPINFIQNCTGTTINNNTFTDFYRGIFLNGGSSVVTNLAITNNVFTDITLNVISIEAGMVGVETMAINYNSFDTNSAYGIWSVHATTVDAEKNWWGHVTGPDPDTEANNPHGSAAAGANISDGVDFMPYWATSTVTTSTEYAGTRQPELDGMSETYLAYSDIIQSGIDAATSNDNYFWVEVYSGGSPYTEDLTIGKKLYLYEAAADATVKITGTHTVTASEVTFDNLVLDANGGIGITVNSSASTISDFTAKNCIFDLMTGNPIGILLGGYTSPNTVSNVLIDNNAFQGPADKGANPWKIGGYYGTPVSCAVDNVDFTNNTVDKCSIPINLQDANINDILIDTNTFTNTDGVVYFWGSNPATGVLSNFVFTNNTIDNTNTYGIGIGGAAVGSPGYTDANFGAGNAVNENWFDGIVGNYGFGAVSLLSPVTNYILDAEDNWWGSINGPDHIGNTFNIDAQGCIVSDNVDYVPWYDTNIEGDSFAPVHRNPEVDLMAWYYSSIQAAIDDASDMDDIVCLYGTFTEDFSVPASVTGLTISSSVGDNGNAIIQGIATLPAASWPLADANIDIWGANTTISDFDIYAPNYVVGYYSSGICIGAQSAYIYNNHFYATSASNTDDICQSMQTYNTIDVSGLNIDCNTFTHKTTPTPGDWGYEAIYINPGPGTGTVTVQYNTLSGKIIRGISTLRSYTTIDNNGISTDLVPMALDWSTAGSWQGINVNGNLTNVTVSNNYIGGPVADVGGEGFLEGLRIGATGNVFTNFQITGNTIDGNYYGIVCKAATGVTVTENAIINNTAYGVKNDDNSDATTLSAEDNWWGDATGPSFTYNFGFGSGAGDEVTTYVDYTPWYDTDINGSTYTPTVTQYLLQLNPTSPVVDTYFDLRVAAADTFGILNPEYGNLVDFSQNHAALTVPDPQLLVNGFKDITNGCISSEIFASGDNLQIYAWEYNSNAQPVYYSTLSNIVIQAAGAPIAPTNVVAADVPDDNGGWITLDYTMSVNDPFHSAAVEPYIDCYIVERDASGAAQTGDWQFLATIDCYDFGGDDVTALLNAPASDVAYEYRMCAVRNPSDVIARTKLDVGPYVSNEPRNDPTDDASQSAWASGGSAAAADNLPAYADIKIFLEGSYVAGGTMNTELLTNGLLPVGAPANAVDLIELQLRSTYTGATVKQADGYVLSDGSVVDEDGNSSFPFYYTTSLEYYFVITHRNHLDIMSANTHTFGDLLSESTTIDLSVAGSVYLDGFNEVETGVYAMYSGDGNASNLVNAADAISILENLNQVSYNSGDLNLSGLTNPADALEIINNLNTAGTVPASGGDDAIVKYEPIIAGRTGEDCTLEIANSTVSGGLYSFDVYITRNASWTANTALGNLFGTFSSVLVFNISANSFSNPQSTNYGSPITGATATMFTNKVQFELVTSTLAVPTTPTLLLTVTLTIDEPTNTAGLSWNGTDTVLYDSSGFGYPSLELLGSDDTPLPVILSSFTTAYVEDTPVIYWTTQSEDGNAGWNLYRGDTEEAFTNGEAFQINPELIPGAWTTSEPTDYEFEDPYEVLPGQEYWYTLESVCYNGETTTYGSRSLLIPESGSGPQLPDYTALKNNYPNPFNPSTEIAYAVKEGEVGTLTIFNIKGQVVESVKLPAGEGTYRWEAGGNSSGVYFYKLKTDSYSKVRKMLLVK